MSIYAICQLCTHHLSIMYICGLSLPSVYLSVSVYPICHLCILHLSSICIPGLSLSLSTCLHSLSSLHPSSISCTCCLSHLSVSLYIYLCVFLSAHFCIHDFAVFLSPHPPVLWNLTVAHTSCHLRPEKLLELSASSEPRQGQRKLFYLIARLNADP